MRTLVVTAIHGLGSVGKSTLAAALAHDSKVQTHFSDGILWATLGREPNLLSLLSGWIQALGDYNFKATSVEAASTQLRTLLYDKAVLIVVDDAWNINNAQAFNIGGARCHILVTTREAGFAQVLKASTFSLDVMTPSEAMKLLTQKLGRNLADTEKTEAEALAKELGYLPLALVLATAQIADGTSWTVLLQDMQQEVARLKTLDDKSARDAIDDASLKQLSLTASLNLSIKQLLEKTRENFIWLGILPEDVNITQAMTATLWDMDDERDAANELGYLQSKALLLSGVPLTNGTPTYRLHDLFHDLARNLLTAPLIPKGNSNLNLPGLGITLPKAHTKFLEKYQNLTENNLWHTLPNDGYIHQHLVWHLEKAQKVEEIHQLLREQSETGGNGWYEACDRLGQTANFVTDVNRAWKLAEEDFTCQSSESITLQCRYALIISSINSIIEKLPTELVLELVKKAPVKGLPYFQKLVKNQNIDLEILSKPEYQLSQIQEEVEKIDNNNIYKIQVKCALAECYSKAELLNILDAVKVIENEKDKGKALKMLISYLSYEQLSEALEGISDKEVVAEIWSLRPKYFREDKDLNEVLDKSKKYNNGYFRAIVLTGLVPYLSLEKISEALNIALDDKQASIEAQSNSLKALATAPHLNKEILQKILQQVEAQQFPPDFATQVWSALLHHFPSDELDNMLDKILEEVDKLEYEQSKAKVLSILVSQLSSVPLDISEKESETLILFKRKPNFWRCLLDRILEEVKKLKDEQYKAEVLSILASQFPSVPLDRILEEVDKLENEEYKAKVLSTLATNIKITKDINIIENVKHIQNRAKAFQGQNNKSSVLSALAKHFCAEEILNILQKELHLIQDDFLMEETIKNLLYYLPLNQQENIPQQLQITLETENDRAKDFTLPFHFSPDKQKNIAQQLEIKRKIENDEGMKELMKLIVETDDNFERMKRLRSLVDELAIKFYSDVDYLHRHWSEMLHNSANRQRDYFLFDFNALIPLISILDQGAIIKICHTLKEIGQQWP